MSLEGDLKLMNDFSFRKLVAGSIKFDVNLLGVVKAIKIMITV